MPDIHDLERKAHAILDTADAEGRPLTSDERAEAETLMLRIELLAAEDGKPIRTGRKTAGGSSSPLAAGVGVANPAVGSHLPEAVRGDGGFAGVGQMLAALAKQAAGAGTDSRLSALNTRNFAMGETISSEGGFFVPVQHVTGILENKTIQPAPLLDRSTKVTMLRQAMSVPSWSDVSHATGAYGLAWGPVGEGDTITEANLTTRALKLSAVKHGLMFIFSSEMIADAEFGPSDNIEKAVSGSLRAYIENKCWRGSGSGEPLGVVGSDATLTIDAEANQATGSLIYENVVNMWARLLPGSHSSAIWVCSQTCLPQLMTMYLVGGVGSTPMSPLVQPYQGAGAADEPSQAIFGRPLHVSENLPSLGTAGDIVLIDPTEYVFGDRKSVIVDVDRSHKFGSDQIAFRVLARFDAQPARSEVFTPANGDTCGFAVMVATRS